MNFWIWTNEMKAWVEVSSGDFESWMEWVESCMVEAEREGVRLAMSAPAPQWIAGLDPAKDVN